ncbi:Gfo/Idh/MocA family protein [Solirhodobacter olei]|uniref:Gfo/Idh/MocA family protein n=1 Tax=Solirhodobacter olei TaxID=2493082 RepID=UPI000FDB57B4|nr:Gfo/Idh/MocA family oxidoreductase [Solirhodobacter olei]
MSSTAYVSANRFPAPKARLRLGLVGGGGGGFIGPVHALAARMDNRYQLVAGALSSNPETARRAGAAFFLDPKRTYIDYREMAEREARRADGIEVVAIATPNHTHHAIARAFVAAGIHVICDKPLTATLEDALDLQRAVELGNAAFYVTHAFAAYPMIRQAREMVRQGLLGDIRLVHVEFMMDWLTEPIDQEGDRHAAWRTDPGRSGKGGAISDIGTHAFHLARFVTGLEVKGLSAQLRSFIPGRALDDNAHVLLRFTNGAEGTLMVSQVAPGNECGLRLRVYGEKAGLEWAQEDSDHLRFAPFGRAIRTLARGEPGLFAGTERMSRVPRGHPEGYLEAFANLYSEIAVDISARATGLPSEVPCLAADIYDGVLGISFVEACVQSSRNGGRWIDPGGPRNALTANMPPTVEAGVPS